MHTFNVWAPEAKSAIVEVSGARHEMQRGQDGWWTASVASAQPGSDYAFRLDGGEARPDPRSPYQPNGVHGMSRLVDHNAYHWIAKQWQAKPLASAVIYELHIGTFTAEGTFRAALQRLDHLVDLGVSHVEIMPVNQFSGPWGWGYDGVTLYAPHHEYGSPDDLKELVDGCHSKGLAILLDVVYNHMGPAGNYVPQFGPYFTNAYSTPWGSAVNLDGRDSYEPRRYFIENALMWLRDYRFDGLRLDAVHALQDSSAVHFLEELSMEVDALSAHLARHFVLIAESDLNDPRMVRSRDAHGYGMDAQWSDDLHHALHSLVTSEVSGYYEDFGSMEHLAVALKEAYVYSGDYSEHRKRHHGRRALGVSGHRFLAYSQNHDQVGNRATGERLSHLISPGLQKVTAALILTSAFIPMLFMGEEFSASTPFQYFTQHEDEDLGHKVSEGRRSEFAAFGWKHDAVPDPQEEQTFQSSKLKWDEVETGIHAEMLDWYKQLLALRKEVSTLTDGRMDEVDTCYDQNEGWFVMTRGPIQVACNFGKTAKKMPVASGAVQLLASQAGCKLENGSVEIPGESVAILET